MDRVSDVLQDRPDSLAQTHRHRGRSPHKRPMDAYPVVKVAPQPQRPLQAPRVPRNTAGLTSQSCLLTTHRPVEALQVRSVDRRADAQLGDPLLDRPESAEECLGLYLDHVAGAVADFVYDASQQSRQRFESGVLHAPVSAFAAAMEDLAEDLQQRRL